MNKTLFALSITILTGATILSCSKSVGKEKVVSACDTLNYTRDIKPIIVSQCATAGCHDAQTRQAGLTLPDDIGTIVANGKFKLRVIDGQPSYMPQSGRLPDDMYEKVKCWIEKGGPQ